MEAITPAAPSGKLPAAETRPSTRPWYIDLLWFGYLAWALPNFALHFWPLLQKWLQAHGHS